MRKLSIASIIFILSLQVTPIVSAIQTNPIERTQTVYSIVDWSGKPTETSVVNWLRVAGDKATTITDNPELENISVLNAKNSYDQSGKSIIWKTQGKEDIYYTGKTAKALPVSITVKLSIDGKPVKPEEVKGKGSLDVELNFTNTLSSLQTLNWTAGDTKKSVTKTVYYPMTIMAQLAMDVADYKEIKGDSTMTVTVGSSTRYTWTAFPKPEASIKFTIISDNLKLPPLQLSILPKTPNIDIPSINPGTMDILGSLGSNPDLFNMLDMNLDFDLGSASQNIDQLTQLLDGVKTAVDTANTGLGQLSLLLKNYGDNFKVMQEGVSGLEQLAAGHKQVIDTMKTQFEANTEGMGEIVSTLQSSSDLSAKVSRDVFKIKSSLEDMGDSIKQLKQKTTDSQMISLLDNLETSRKSAYDKVDPIKTYSDTTNTNLKTLLDGGTLNGKEIPSVSSLPDQLKLLGDALTALSTGGTVMNQKLPGLTTTIDGLKGLNDGLTLIIKGGKAQGQTIPPFSDLPKQLTSATDGLNMLVKGGTYNGMKVPPQSEMRKMIADFKAQLAKMPDTKELSKNLESIKIAINKAGGSAKVKEAMDETQKLVYEDQAEFAKMKELGDSYTSFIGKTDNAVSSVIFVIKFADISSNVTNSNSKDHYNSEKSIMDSSINKYKYYILGSALFIIIIAFPINWIYKKRQNAKK